MLVADQEEKLLGNLKFGQAHNFKYILTNSGNTTIIITKIVLGCSSCTEITNSKQIIGIGENTVLDVIFTPGAIGISSKQIQVLYNNETEESIMLKFKSIITK